MGGSLEQKWLTPKRAATLAILIAVFWFCLGYFACYLSYSGMRRDVQSLVAYSLELRKENEMHVAKWNTLEILTERGTRLSPDAARLLRETASSEYAAIEDSSQRRIRIEGVKSDITDGSPRSYANWKAALQELLSRGYLEHSTVRHVGGPYTATRYVLTKAGYQAAEAQ